jgi:hypothetical protein
MSQMERIILISYFGLLVTIYIYIYIYIYPIVLNIVLNYLGNAEARNSYTSNNIGLEFGYIVALKPTKDRKCLLQE